MTYAQKNCCGAAAEHLQAVYRYQTHSEPKLLIHIALLNCFFYGQSGESLDSQGLQPSRGNLSTKLSTEKLDIFKAFLNQALSVFFACIERTMSTISHILNPDT
ncbi:MAG: hypothetical protein HQ446_04430 [Polaromonas sp.]|nr:hypothetical protein [Polaromonas sp.]